MIALLVIGVIVAFLISLAIVNKIYYEDDDRA
jgi:hypothetical protein